MNIFQRAWVSVVVTLGKMHWSPKNLIIDSEKQRIRELLVFDYYVILTRRNNHFSTYMISFANFVLTGKFSYWGHAFMNLEDEVKTDDDFIFVEAVGTGVHETHFDNVFDVNSVVLLKPKNLTIEKWTAILDEAKRNEGKPYDNLFDLKNDNAMSCVELVRDALQADPDYATNFAHFEAMIAKRKNLTPEMFYQCEDFEVVCQIRRR
jgi:hypothetical protein